jgi:hypothetical protein
MNVTDEVYSRIQFTTIKSTTDAYKSSNNLEKKQTEKMNSSSDQL